MSTQPELPIDPPAEIEVYPELTELIAKAHFYRQRLQSKGIELAEVDLLTPDEDRAWEYAFEAFETMLAAAAGRVEKVSADRRKAEAEEDDPDFEVGEAADAD